LNRKYGKQQAPGKSPVGVNTITETGDIKVENAKIENRK